MMTIAGSTGTAGADDALTKPGFEEEALPCLSAVYRFALRLSRGNEAEAEDLTQETFLRAYNRWETYARGTRCLSWLFTICRNVALRRSEVRGRCPEFLATDLGFDDPTVLAAGVHQEAQTWDAEGSFFEALVDEEVLRAVDRLPADFREAVVLCDLEGFAYGEIAELLQIPPGTVKSRIHRGRRLLQAALYDYAVEMGYVRGESADCAAD